MDAEQRERVSQYLAGHAIAGTIGFWLCGIAYHLTGHGGWSALVHLAHAVAALAGAAWCCDVEEEEG